jgi:thiamine biosynthesis lipoprotein
MSLYDPKSELSKINNFADIQPIEVTADTIKVIKRADELNKITEGAIDITIAPLVELWGFGPKGAVSNIPIDKEVKDALKLTGMDKIKIDYARKTVRFVSGGVKIDLGSVAPGYAVDCAIGVLREMGVRNAMVNAGGEIFCIGKGPWFRLWRVGIQHPRVRDKLLAVVKLQEEAISTSGDYEKFFFYNNKRISHIIDPRTGRAVSNSSVSVSIIAPDCITADALATTIYVLGLRDGMKVLNKIGSVEGMIVVCDGENIKVHTTDGFFKKK